MPARTESGKVASAYKRNRPKKRPTVASQGHPSRGGTSVGGGTGGKPPTRYKSPTPRPTVAPISDVRGRGDKAKRGSGYTSRAERIKRNRAERRSALRQLLEPTGFGANRSVGPERGSTPRVEFGGIPSPAAVRALAREENKIARDLAKLKSRSTPRHERTAAAERLADVDVVSSLAERRARAHHKDPITRELDRYKKDQKQFLQKAGMDVGLGDVAGKVAKATAAPALKILDESTRVAEAGAGAAKYYVRLAQGKEDFDPLGPLKGGIESGVTRKDRTTFSDVLREAGAENRLQDVGVSKGTAHTLTEIAGLAADIGLDPLTYLTFGVSAPGSAAAKAAKTAAETTFAKELAGGATRKQANKAASRAARKVYSQTPKNRGITVGVGKRQTSGKTSGKVLRKSGASNIAAKVSESKAAQGARAVFPVKPVGMSEKEWLALKAADLERRGAIVHGTRRISRKARAIRKATGGTYRRVLPERPVAGEKPRLIPRRRKAAPIEVSARVKNAIEAGDLSTLAPTERKAAELFQAEQERLLQVRRDSGEKASRYRPRSHEEQRVTHAVEAMAPRQRLESAIRKTEREVASRRAHAARAEGGATVHVAQADRRILERDDAYVAARKKLSTATREFTAAGKRLDNAVLYGKGGGRAVPGEELTRLRTEFRAAQRRVAVARKQTKKVIAKIEARSPTVANRRPIRALRTLEKYQGKAAEAENRLAALKALRGRPDREIAAKLISKADVDASMARRGADLVDEPKGYVHRTRTEDLPDKRLVKREQRAVRRSPARRTTTMKDWRRTDRRPLEDVRATQPGKYVEDLETTLRVKGEKDLTRAANTRFRNRVLETGRRLKPSTKWDPETEAVYRVENGRLVEVKDATPGGDVVILKRAVADHANRTVDQGKRIPFLDRTTSTIKWWLTVPNPQYWMRNAYGGSYNAWQTGVKVTRNAPTAIRVNRRIALNQRAEETIGAKPKSLTERVTGKRRAQVAVLPKGGKMDIDEFVDELERVNISGGGMTTELIGAEVRRRGKAQGAEDFPRVVAYIHFRRKGHTPEESARLTLRSQFDYGDLSAAERDIGRRIFPFYTFRSRNVAHQGRTVLQRPGKIATTEKVRDTLARVAGLPEGWQDALQEGEQAGVPIPTPFEINVPGLGKQQVLLYPGLPITDLNLFTLNPTSGRSQIMSSFHPLLKSGIEFWTNYNFFWRDKIEGEGQRWVAAPDKLLDNLPDGAKNELVDAGIIKMGKDRWTGKWTWQWRGKADYLAKLTPITSTGFLALTSGRSRKGQDAWMRGAGWLTGFRPQPYSPKENAYFSLLEEIGNLETRKADMIELRTHKKKDWDADKNSGEEGWDSPEYARVKKRLTKMYEQKFNLEGELGKADRSRPQGVAGPTKSAYQKWKDSQGSEVGKYKKWKRGQKSEYDKYLEWKQAG